MLVQQLNPGFQVDHGQPQGAPFVFEGLGRSDLAAIFYTSGTTGFPKGAMHSQRSFVTGGEAFVQRVYLQDDDRVMVLVNRDSKEATASFMLPAAWAGRTVVDDFSGKAVAVSAGRLTLAMAPEKLSGAWVVASNLTLPPRSEKSSVSVPPSPSTTPAKSLPPCGWKLSSPFWRCLN